MTSREPGRTFVDRIKAMEGRDGILSISVAHGFTAADVVRHGHEGARLCDRTIATRRAALAERLAREILAWGPSGGGPRHLKPEEAIAAALAIAGQPVVLADRWDNPGGGVAGDSTVMVEALLSIPKSRRRSARCGTRSPFPSAARPARGARSRFASAGRRRRPPGDRSMRPCASARPPTTWSSPSSRASCRSARRPRSRIGNLDVVLASTRAQTFSPPVFTNLGIDLAAKKIVVVKSSNHFYAAFAPIAAEVLYLDTGGPLPVRSDEGRLHQGAPPTRTAGSASMAVTDKTLSAAPAARKLWRTSSSIRSTKGLPFGTGSLRLGDVGAQGWNMLAGDLPLPLAVIRRDVLAANSAWMSAFTARERARASRRTARPPWRRSSSTCRSPTVPGRSRWRPCSSSKSAAASASAAC